MRSARREAAITLIEIMVVVAIIGVMAAMAAPRCADIVQNQNLKRAARGAGDLFLLARAEAMRTGNYHVVFFGGPGLTDGGGTPVQDTSGGFVPMAVLNDGTPATANCHIDGGEPFRTLQPIDDVNWGVTHATVAAPGDNGSAAFTSGFTFADAANNALNWVMFRPDGIPVVFTTASGNCDVIEPAGSGGGGLYVTNGDRDYSVVVTPMGGVRVRSWNPSTGAWSG